jgi:hypothetical protein
MSYKKKEGKKREKKEENLQLHTHSRCIVRIANGWSLSRGKTTVCCVLGPRSVERRASSSSQRTSQKNAQHTCKLHLL